MRSTQLLITAVIVFGWCSWASASPLIPRPSGASLDSPRDLETARWRHRYRRGDDSDDRRRPIVTERDATDGFNSNGVNRPFIEIIRPEGRRRGRWVDPPPPE
jgi:hypothetical protein